MKGNSYVGGGTEIQYLTTEDGDYITTEDGNYIILSDGTYDYKYWGGCTSKDEDKIYYFLMEDDGHNCLIEYTRSTDTFRNILYENTKLELDPNHFVHDCFYEDGWIYYNAGEYGLKKIHVERAYNYTNIDTYVSGESYTTNDLVKTRDGFVYYAVVSTTDTPLAYNDSDWYFYDWCYPFKSDGNLYDTAFSLTNIPPYTKIVPLYGSDTDYHVNNIRKKVFQFTYRWKYRDHGYSITAPISTVSLPIDDESSTGEILNSITTNNYINLSFDRGRFGEVEYVELFFRDGNEGNWKYIDRFINEWVTGDFDEYYNRYVVPYRFYNDRVYAVADDNEINSLSDNVPKKANDFNYLSENVLIAAAVTEGFDNIEPDVTLDYGTEEVTLSSLSTLHDSFSKGTEVIQDAGPGRYIYFRKIDLSSSFSATANNDIGVIDIEKRENGSEYPSYLYIRAVYSTSSMNVTDFRDWCISKINDSDSDIRAGYGSPPSGMTLNTGDFYVYVYTNDPGYSLYETDSYIIRTYAQGTAEINKHGDFKTGAHHPFAIVYYDEEMRPFSAVRSDDMTIYIPTLPEINTSSNHSTYNERFYVTWEINHTPPPEAKYYQWFYAGNTSIEKFWQYVLSESSPTDTTGDYLRLTINPLQTVKDSFPNTNIETYSFQPGDRVRVLTQASTSGGEYGDVVASTDISDVEIIKYEESGSDYYIHVPKPSPGTYQAGVSSLIEIYRPKQIQDDGLFFYAIGDVYEIVNGYHRGQKQDQTAYVPATGIFDSGDAYFIARSFSEFYSGLGAGENLLLVQSESYSDFYDSDSYDKGKVNVESTIGEITKNNIRWSNKLVVGTGTNGLARFNALDYVSLPDRYGSVQKTVQVGDVLKVYTPVKPIYVSIGRMEVYNASGSSTVNYYDKVLGGFRVGVDDYGTSNPESVVKYRNNVYGFDSKKGFIGEIPGTACFQYQAGRTQSIKCASILTARLVLAGLYYLV